MQEFGLEMLTDLVGHGPLMPFFAGLGPEVNLLLAERALNGRITLALIQAHDHAEVLLSQQWYPRAER